MLQAAQLQHSFSTATSACSSASTAGWSLKVRRRPSSVSYRPSPKFWPRLIQRSRCVFRSVSISVQATSSESSCSTAPCVLVGVVIIRSFRAVVHLDEGRMLVKVDLMSRIERKEITPPESLAIGEVARLSGKAPSAIRYYEEVGLVEAPERVSGRRRYPRACVRTLAVIETAQRAGL